MGNLLDPFGRQDSEDLKEDFGPGGGAEMLEALVHYDHIRDRIYDDLTVKDLLAVGRTTAVLRDSVSEFKLKHHPFYIAGSAGEGLRYRECTRCDWTDDHCPANYQPLDREATTIQVHRDLLHRGPQINKLRIQGRLPTGRGADANRYLYVMQILLLRSTQLTHLDLRLRISDYYGGDSRGDKKGERYMEFIKAMPVFERVTNLRLNLELGNRTHEDLATQSPKWLLLSKFPAVTAVDTICLGDYIPRLDHLPNPQLLRRLEMDNGQDCSNSYQAQLPHFGNPSKYNYNLVPLNTFRNLTFLRIGNRTPLPSLNGGIDWLGAIAEDAPLPPIEYLHLEMTDHGRSAENHFDWLVSIMMAINKKCAGTLKKLNLNLYDMGSSNTLINALDAFHHRTVHSRKDWGLNFPEVELNRNCSAKLLGSLAGRYASACKVRTLRWTFDHFYNVEPDLKGLPYFGSIIHLELKGTVYIKSLGGLLAKFPALSRLDLNFDFRYSKPVTLGNNFGYSSEESSDESLNIEPDLSAGEPRPDWPNLVKLCPTLSSRLKELSLGSELKLKDDSLDDILDVIRGLAAVERLTIFTAPDDYDQVTINLWDAVQELADESSNGLKSLSSIVIKVYDHQCEKHYNTEKVMSRLIGYSLPRSAGLGGWSGNGLDVGLETVPENIRWQRTSRDEITFTIQ